MTNIDQFESVFNAASKTVYQYQRIVIDRILLVTDVDADTTGKMLGELRRYLAVLDADGVEWMTANAGDYDDVEGVMKLVKEREAELVITYRHLKTGGWGLPYSLGGYLDVLTQALGLPVLVLPHPEGGRALPHALKDTNRVMAMTDHLTGDDQLVNYAVRMTAAGGQCWLTHVEDDVVFERYMDCISKLTELDTDVAREVIQGQLLKEPAEYIETARRAIPEAKLTIELKAEVRMGRRLAEYKKLVQEHDVDLLVMHTKDQDQWAMHGMAYPLAVEMREIPLLML